MTTFLAASALVWTLLLQPTAGWTAEAPDPKCFSDTAGVMTIDPCAGWIRSGGAYENFAVSFEVRARAGGSLGIVGVSGVNATGGTPAFALGVPLLGPVNFAALQRPATQIEAVPVNAAAAAGSMHHQSEWQEYMVTSSAGGLSVQLNGVTIVAGATPRTLGAGWIGLRAVGGAIEIRNIHFGQKPTGVQTTGAGPALPPSDAGAPVRPGNGITLPKLLHEARPNYTAEALKAKIQGAVVLEVVVNTDGSVSHATVVRSLDATFGLDEEALRCAKLWKFAPGTRNGVPVPVLVSIEMAFTLKR